MKYLKLYEEFNTKIDMNAILNGYLECAIWTEEEKMSEDEDDEISSMYGLSDEDDDIDDKNQHDDIRNMIPKAEMTIDNVSDNAKIKAYNDIKKFLNYAGDAINGIEESQLGHDIWLTRNHHGAGFFDRGYPKNIAKKLDDAATKLGDEYLFIGEDGMIHFESEDI